MVTVPAPFSVTRPVLASTVANDALLLLYVTAPELALDAVTVNAASVTFFAEGGLTNARVGVALETVSVLLVLVELTYRSVATCVALKVTFPNPTIVIKFPDASMVATLGLLLLYIIATLLLLLVGRVVIAKDPSKMVLELATVNVDDDSVDVPRATVSVLLVLVALKY